MAAERQITITLNPQGVIAPALTALRDTVEVVSLCLRSIESADHSIPPESTSSRIHLKFDEALEPSERKRRHLAWLLAKGFQDFARGIRLSLEEAYFYLGVLELPQGSTWGQFQENAETSRKTASRLTFPDLMQSVNKRLNGPLDFTREYLSLQKVRNCLEHRNGIVSPIDVEPGTNKLVLSLPRLKAFYEQDGEEVELKIGTMIEKDTVMQVKREVHSIVFSLGDVISFDSEQFHDIGFGCWFFAQDLATKLPQPAPRDASSAP